MDEDISIGYFRKCLGVREGARDKSKRKYSSPQGTVSIDQ